MCYSAQIRAEHREFTRMFGATLSIREFVELFYARLQSSKVKIPKAMEAAFEHPTSPEEFEVKQHIDAYKAERSMALEQELFAQRKRHADAERKLLLKETKTALESRRIAANNVDKLKQDLSDLTRTELLDRDSRIFPLVYAPVMTIQHGKKIVRPMRYQCRVAGMPVSSDVEYKGTYNARRESLEGFWRNQFGYTHGVVIMDAFYEHVSKHKLERRELSEGEREKSVELEFRPRPAQQMLVACVWSHWRKPGEPDLLSFAAITDEPPPEIAAAGHDRCIIPIRPENVDAWLNPDPRNLKVLYDILDDRERPYYEHLLAA